MAALTDEQKLEVVMMLAHFSSANDIVKAFRARGEEITPRQTLVYDPTKPYFEAGEKWRTIFLAERERFLTEVSSIPIASQSFRLNMLQKMFTDAVQSGNRGQAAELLEQAAKEVGGVLTNERKLAVTRDFDPESFDDKKKMIGDLIDGALGRAKGDGQTIQ